MVYIKKFSASRFNPYALGSVYIYGFNHVSDKIKYHWEIHKIVIVMIALVS